MAADRSSAIPAAVADPDHARLLAVDECPGLLERLAMIPATRVTGGVDDTPWPACWPSAPRRWRPAPRCPGLCICRAAPFRAA